MELEWDRGHERLTAVVEAESRLGLVVAEVVDLVEAPGRRWIRADEVVDIEDLALDDPAVRLAELRGTATAAGGAAEPTDLAALLRRLQATTDLVGVYRTRTGSDECLVGRIETVTADHVVLAEVNPRGTTTGDRLQFPLAKIIAVDWATTYLTALAELAGAGAGTGAGVAVE